MKRKRYTEQQTIKILSEAEAGVATAELSSRADSLDPAAVRDALAAGPPPASRLRILQMVCGARIFRVLAARQIHHPAQEFCPG